MTNRSLRMLSIACFIVLSLFVATLSATVPVKQDRDTSISKQQNAVPSAAMHERAATVEGRLMGQIPILAKDAFQSAIILPEAPVMALEHIPLAV